MTSVPKLLGSVQHRSRARSSVSALSDIDIENQFDKWKAFQPTFVYDVSVNQKGCIYWYWSCIVSIAIFYNLIFITLVVFDDIRDESDVQFLIGNIVCDVIYIVDIWFQTRIYFTVSQLEISFLYQPSPNETFQSVFEILDTVIGMLLFAGIVGSVADLVATANRVKTDWQQRMDSLKQFMMYRNIHSEFQQRVLKYCEYEMSKMENMSELEMRNYLPPILYTQVC
uniref:Ion_trans domain-containing protein n=1 Tax=Angiostrongylus cantonensis TaxID=6313 RepID=A0A0K0CYL6_ANGCA